MSKQKDLNEALYWAIKDHDVGEVVALLNEGADINKQTIADWSPLAHAADLGYLDLVKLLLERGADVNQVNADGFTALHWARERGFSIVAQLLVDHGAEL